MTTLSAAWVIVVVAVHWTSPDPKPTRRHASKLIVQSTTRFPVNPFCGMALQ